MYSRTTAVKTSRARPVNDIVIKYTMHHRASFFKRVIFFGVLVSSLGGLFWLWHQQTLSLQQLRTMLFTLRQHNVALPLVAVVIAQHLWIPRMWCLIALGAVYGPLHGGLLSLVADLISANISYWLARLTTASWLQSYLVSRRPTHAELIRRVITTRGLSSIILLRITPVPYILLSYLAGLMAVSWPRYVLGTVIGCIPAALIYPPLGHHALDGGYTWVAVLALLAMMTFVASIWQLRSLAKGTAR